ncbi:hypothetical protein ABJI51_15020 [Amycolatopsis sp. NEAU-NG30]|uniref:Uncharacterized protein n=1 Tax=Amycolatopsis melonis TaxID=3156488 RepID=A0ABV0LDM9_9PSEU
MVDFKQLTELDVAGLETFAEQWALVHQRLHRIRDGYESAVVTPLEDGEWEGKGGAAATKYCARIRWDFDAVDAEVKALRRYIDTEADGAEGTAGLKGLEGHQRAVLDLQRQAREHGMTVTAEGKVTHDDTAGYFDALGEQAALADELERKIQAHLKQATEIDQELARNLKVVFGTRDNFETEDRRYGVLPPTEHDRRVWNQLHNVVLLGLVRQGNDHAAWLLQHYLDGDGTTVEAPVQDMLDDMPSFRERVDKEVAQLGKRPDGPFTTEWTTTAPDLDRDGKGGQDWYYSFNHFQYRLVGEKHGDEVVYHVEIQKRYDWGIPSEHRRDLEKSTPLLDVDFEQADIAHLNTTGMARDFDVVGSSAQKTARV